MFVLNVQREGGGGQIIVKKMNIEKKTLNLNPLSKIP